MDVILTKNVEKLGRKGEIKTVKPGYYMNYLCPSGLAIKATSARLKWAEKIADTRIKEQEEILNQAKELKKKLENSIVAFDEKITDKGTLYGSIGEKEIQKAIEDQLKLKLEKKQIKLAEPIKTVGEHKVTLQLTDDVPVEISINISEKKS